MQQEKQWISSKRLFTAIEEELSNGKNASFTVTGMSMWPFLCHGRDQVIVTKPDISKLKKGDIILYYISDSKYLLHRITLLEKDHFQTTGDSNYYRDAKYPYDRIIGVVSKVVRDQKEIGHDHLIWKCCSHIWMLLFPVRPLLISNWMKIRKFFR